MVAMEGRIGKFSRSKTFTRPLPKPVAYESSPTPTGVRLIQSQPVPLLKASTSLNPEAHRKRKQTQELQAVRNRNFFSKNTVYLRLKRCGKNNEQSLRFPLLGPNRQEAEQFFQEQEKAK